MQNNAKDPRAHRDAGKLSGDKKNFCRKLLKRLRSATYLIGSGAICNVHGKILRHPGVGSRGLRMAAWFA